MSSRLLTVMALALLAAPSAASAPPLPDCEAGVRRIQLSANATGKLPEVCILPGKSTTMFHDSNITEVELEGRQWFQRVKWTDDTLILQPSEELPAGKRLLLTVYFEDGKAPTSSTLMLVVHPSQAEQQVEVFRSLRSVVSYQRELQQVRTEVQQCRDEKARLQFESAGQVGFTGMFANGLIGEEGVPFRDLGDTSAQGPENTLYASKARSYRSTTIHRRDGRRVLRLAMAVWVWNQGTKPWMAVGGALVGPTGESLGELMLWPREPVGPGESKRLVTELEVLEGEHLGSWTLKLWDEHGTVGVLFGGVTFP